MDVEKEWAHFFMLRTKSAAAGSFIFSRNSAKLREAVASASSLSSAILAAVPSEKKELSAQIKVKEKMSGLGGYVLCPALCPAAESNLSRQAF